MRSFTNFRKVYLAVFFLFTSFITIAQDDNEEPSSGKIIKLEISGTLFEDGTRLEDVLVSATNEDGKVVETYSDMGGKFKIEFDIDEISMLRFTKNGYAEKMVEVDTRNIPSNNRKYDFAYKGWKVDMFPTDLEVDFSSLKKPVAKVVYNPAEESFSTDKQYERSVRPSRERLLKAVYAAYDERDEQVEGAFDDYMLAVKDGDIFLKEGDYENALIQYEAAKDILPNETYPDKQIKKTMALMQENASEDEQYANYLTIADEAFESKKWEEARKNYEMAQGVKPKMDYPGDQIDKIVQSIAAEKLAAAQMAEKEKLDLYNSLVAKGDSLMNAKSYSASKSEYKKAIAVLSKEYPKTKIKEIDALLAQNAKTDKAYESLLANANKFFSEKKYDQAKEMYSNALGVKPDAQQPKDKIAEIDGLLAGLAAMQELEEKLAAKKEEDLKKKYDALIVSADALFVDKSYEKSKAEYEKALVLKSNEEYPQNQIKLINSALAEMEGIDKQYAKLMQDANSNKAIKKWDLAKSNYLAALELKPTEQAPKDGIAEIDAKLAEIDANLAAKEKAIQDKYEGFIAEADAMMTLEKYNEAESLYKEALTVKSKEEYPKSQIALISDKRKALAIAAAASEKEAKELAAKESAYAQSIGRADQMFKLGDLSNAKLEYQKSLEIFAGKAYPISQISEIEKQLSLLAAEEEQKAQQAAAEKAKEDEYALFVSKGDAAFNANDFVSAKLAYQNAQKVFSDRPYPGTQIEKMVGLELAAKEKAEQEALALAEAEENEKRFEALILEGDQLVDDKELVKGKYKYEAALKLKPSDPAVQKKMRDVTAQIEAARKLAEFRAKNDTEFNRQLAIDYPNGLNETKKSGGKTTTRIVIVEDNRGDEFKKEVYSYGAVFYFKNGKKIDENTFKRETKGH